LGVPAAGQREVGEGSVQVVVWKGVESQEVEQDSQMLPRMEKGERSP
jgi:hypothetical protein